MSFHWLGSAFCKNPRIFILYANGTHTHTHSTFFLFLFLFFSFLFFYISIPYYSIVINIPRLRRNFSIALMGVAKGSEKKRNRKARRYAVVVHTTSTQISWEAIFRTQCANLKSVRFEWISACALVCVQVSLSLSQSVCGRVCVSVDAGVCVWHQPL